jgi:hypothetical protein
MLNLPHVVTMLMLFYLGDIGSPGAQGMKGEHGAKGDYVIGATGPQGRAFCNF